MEDKSDTTRALLIVDPQIDFINGSLPVPGAVEAMDALSRYVKEHGHRYGHILITCDRHPLNHSSFKHFGGTWPIHCVESSVGAAVWPALMDNLLPFYNNVRFYYKGENPSRDEYSIFQSKKEAHIAEVLLQDKGTIQLDICGLAGDVCVKATLEDTLNLYPRIHISILEEFTASLDGGEYIRSVIPTLQPGLKEKA